jgi:prepilin-type processing-associated H-X9-DG protein
MPTTGFVSWNSGPFKKERIPNPFNLHLVWDGQNELLSYSASFEAFKQEIIVAGRSYWNNTIYRHGRGISDTKAGPNVLMADGHVEYGYDLNKLTRDNVNVASR